MPTTIDLRVGLNLVVGSLPVSLSGEITTQGGETVYTFNGCVQDATLPLSTFLARVCEQFGVDVQLPPELNLAADIQYLAGQLVYGSGATGTTLGVAGSFVLTDAAAAITTVDFYASTSFASAAPATGNPFMLGAGFTHDLDFSKLPLVGDIPGFRDLTLTNVGFCNSNAAAPPSGGDGVTFAVPSVTASPNPLYTQSDPDAADSKAYVIESDGTRRTLQIDSKGFSLTAELRNSSTGDALDSFALPMAMPVSSSQDFYPEATSPPASPVHWIKVDRTFGPVSLQKIGLTYGNGEATFGLIAGFGLAGFALDLDGLTITFPLPLPGQATGRSVSFDLEGLAINLQLAGFGLGGAFLKAADGSGYYGEIMVQAATFGLKALGGYTPGSPPSFFLYADLQVPLGGPPFLYVTALAGGLGINRTLTLPTIDGLAKYPLLPANAPPAEPSAVDTVRKVLPTLEHYFVDKPGEYWIAAGIEFTSFEMIDAFALLTLSVGVDLQIAVLGSCSMTFPQGDPYPLSYVDVNLVASFAPASGLLAVGGVLSPASFIYGGFVHLGGGFAFYTWFDGDHQGDFVVSLGGYHPLFDKPAHYPSVPRLTLTFGLGPFHAQGQAYFALTPAMMMAGIAMSAVWSASRIRVSLDAAVDFVLAWAPFHYEADVYIALRCSVDVGLFTVHAHAGATLHVWGPAFGGTARVDLHVAKFTIAFGAAATAPAPVGWQSFKTNFLPNDTTSTPAPQTTRLRAARQRSVGTAMAATSATASAVSTNIVKASVATGLLRAGTGGFDWIVDSDDFAIRTNSTIPANVGQWQASSSQPFDIPNRVASFNPAAIDVTPGPYLDLPADTKLFSATQVWNPTLHIGPMNQDNVQSVQAVELRRRGETDRAGTFTDYVTAVSAAPVVMDSNAALWSQNGSSATPSSQLVPSTLVGFLITPVPRQPDAVSDVPLIDLLFADDNSTTFSYTEPAADTSYTVSATVDASDDLIIDVGGAHSATLTNQGRVLSALGDSWITAQRGAVLADLTANGFSTCTAAQVDVAALATQKALTNWPVVTLLGA